QDLVFELVNAPPRVSIDYPLDGATFYAGQRAYFSAYAYDLETSKLLAPTSVSWASNREGAIGVGSWVQREFTVLGEHQITVTGRDNDGASATDSRRVTVLPPPPDGLPPTAFIYTFDYDYRAPNPVLTLGGVGHDAEDGALSGARLEWRLESDSIEWNIPGGVAYGNTPQAVLNPVNGRGDFRVRLTVTDSTGKTAEVVREGSLLYIR
ncbi:MAG: hypothetical protein KDA32_10855, partial [Phycisphaerales bacterium]|nr:hypothetical protein [Phycisphaerales bacterium]